MNRQAPQKGLHGWLADIAAALILLTVLPLPPRWQQSADWPRALRALPLVGALVGLASGLAVWLAQFAGLPAPVVVLLALLTGVALTGALHEDGLADVADALGGHTRERRLAIMRDSRAGSFAILALVFAIGLQAAALTALLAHGAAAATAALVLAHAVSRLAAVWMMFALPHARSEGMSVQIGRPDFITLMQGAMLAALAALLVLPWLPARPLVALLLAGFVAVALRLSFRNLLGGQTGDAIGATEVMVRTTVLLAL